MSTTEVPVSHVEAALRLLENLRTMQSSIDGFIIPPSPLDRQSRPRGHMLLPNDFFVSLAVALESSPQFAASLQAAMISLTPAEIRDMLRYGEAYLPVADELERFARGIRHTVRIRRAKIGRVAASAYRVAKGLNLLVDVSLPVPEVESMKRAFGTRRRKAAEPVPVPVKASP
ncbi:MAG TPA: hypothetical protein VGQ36_16860 [Thermoanaerobaculia bacterium]|jgi:hypothetical protein|nr:hypothetical protein [Thermoanaerobaculia bacterium]